MKDSLINRIVLCDGCHSAFIINVEGDSTTCDLCLAETEIDCEPVDENLLSEITHNISEA